MSWQGKTSETFAAIRAMEYVGVYELHILTGFSLNQIGKWRKMGLLSHIPGRRVRYHLQTALAEIKALQECFVETTDTEGGAA